jgi:hypothetical protein
MQERGAETIAPRYRRYFRISRRDSHSPGVLHRVTYKGAPLVKGKRVIGFTNDEEETVHLTHVVPFLVEDELKRLGAIFEKVPNWQPFSIADGRLITGQNPASSTSAALKVLAGEKAASAQDPFPIDERKGSSSVVHCAGQLICHLGLDREDQRDPQAGHRLRIQRTREMRFSHRRCPQVS